MEHEFQIENIDYSQMIETIFKHYIDSEPFVETSYGVIKESGGLECFIKSNWIGESYNELIQKIWDIQLMEMMNRYGDLWFIYQSFKSIISKLRSKTISNRSDFVKMKLGWCPNLEDLAYQVLSQVDNRKSFHEITSDLFLFEVSNKEYYELCKGVDLREDEIWDGNDLSSMPNDIIREFIDTYPKMKDFEEKQWKNLGKIARRYLDTVIRITEETDEFVDCENEDLGDSKNMFKLTDRIFRPVFNEEIRDDIISSFEHYFTPRNEFTNLVYGYPIKCKIDFNGTQAKLAGIFVRLRLDGEIVTGTHEETYEFIKSTFTIKGEHIVTRQIFRYLTGRTRIDKKNLPKI